MSPRRLLSSTRLRDFDYVGEELWTSFIKSLNLLILSFTRITFLDIYNINYFAYILGFYSDNTNKNIRIIELTLTSYKFYIALCYIVLFSHIRPTGEVNYRQVEK